MIALRRAPLVGVAALAWLAAGVLAHLPAAAAGVAAASWTAAIVLLVRSLTAQRGALLVVAAAAMAAAATQVAIAYPDRIAAAEAATDGRVDVAGTVTTKVERSEAGARFDLDATLVRTTQDDTAVAAAMRVLRVTNVPDGLDLGARVTVSGTTAPAEAGESAVVVLFADAVTVREPPPGLLGVTSAVRDGFVAAVAGLPDPGGGLLPGLAVGDTRAVGAELDDAMIATSLSHLTAVSGANCAIITGLVFAIAALCGARRSVRVAVALLALAGFVLLVTPEASVVRAGAMGLCVLVALLLGRPAAGLSALGLAVTVLLVADPWLSTSVGFALSAAATAALLVLAPPLARGLGRWMPRALALAIAVPAAAQIACGPLLLLIDPVVPVYGVVANIIAAPAAPAATVLGLAACLTAAVPLLSGVLAALAWLPASWVAHTALAVATWPGVALPWIEGAWGVAALVLLGAAAVALVAAAGAVRVAAGVGMLALTVGAVAVSAISPRVALHGAPADWAIAACDVGQGDAVLLRAADRVALIDVGPDPAPLEACLRQLGIAHIDVLVLTHFDADHVGGIDAVIGKVHTVAHGPPEDAADEVLLTALADAGAELTTAVAGLTGTLGDALWRVHWPRPGDPVFAAGNDASVIIEVHGGSMPRTLLLGDLSARAQRALAASGAVGAAAQVVKVAHHGSADQDHDLYRALTPDLALVTVGANDYGHPRAEILQLLDALGTAIARTDVAGLVLVAAGDTGLRVWREHAAAGVSAAD